MHATVILPALVCAEVSFWSANGPKLAETAGDQASVTLGLPFQSQIRGSVTAVRVLSLEQSGPVHTAQLWSDSGALLATARFADRAEAGWLVARFAWPIEIEPQTRYLVSYFAPNGGYPYTRGFSWAEVERPPLFVAPPHSGVFAYGMSPSFPDKVFGQMNYWVDVQFEPSTYEIRGRVLGAPALLNVWGPVARQVVTSAAGRYWLGGLPEGVYFVTPRATGVRFSPATKMVVIAGNSAPDINFNAARNAAFIPHLCSLSWKPGTSRNISGYNIYRANQPGGPYVRLNAALLPGSFYVDTEVEAGKTYYYTVTAVDTDYSESARSEETQAQIPRP